MSAQGQPPSSLDYVFVNPLPEHLECPICLSVLKEPHVISCCGHHFCEVCIQRVHYQEKPCPLCKEGNFSTMLHKGVMREVNGLEVKCPNERQGCPWNGELGKVANHVNGHGVVESGENVVCKYAIVMCIYQCGFQCQRRYIQSHEMDECTRRPVEVQLRSYSRKIDMVTKEIKQLTVKLNRVEAENSHLKERVSKLEHAERQKPSTHVVETLRKELRELETVAMKRAQVTQRPQYVGQIIPKPTEPLNVVMIADLKEAGVIKTQRVEDTMKIIDRKHYTLYNHYVDKPQSIGHNTTISAPHMHAHTLELVCDVLGEGATALDIGSGSGYLTACMAYMCAPGGYAVGIDCVSDLTVQANKNIMQDNPELLRHNIFLTTGDGHLGYPPKAPYDVIHVGGATPNVPQALYDQLKVGGRMIVPVGPPGGNQYLEQHDKQKNGTISKKRLMGVRYGPLLQC